MADASFEGVYNFRDVGAAINALNTAPILQEKMIYRSGRLDGATEGDRRKLVEQYNLQTVVDLRTKSEHIRQGTDKLALRPWKTVFINFVSHEFEINLLRQLRWWQIIQFVLLMLLRFRISAIRILGQNVLKRKGLIGLSRDSLRFCQAEILAALNVFILPMHTCPVLVHCTQGKDRSGLVIMLVLFVLSVPLQHIKAEYSMSELGLAPVRKSLIGEVEEIGMDEAYTRAPEEVVQAVWDCLETEYGGVDRYLDLLGFHEEKRRTLRKILLV
ncbi:Tyrosine serine protein [Mycena indigotica]|uniref:Tyrosine serine protein n=1 Tax=Mycena indigotica TaxID=2126181 RepID=A0A8H6SCT1_9AGAR|nr:Tyrosine serine protein [Mycena indigotica]KAF7297170.1 Tyrosine serine protein [Mycena indigotica]